MADNVQTTAEAEKTKYLSKAGLTTFWGKVKALVTAAVVTVGDYTVNGKKISTNPVITKGDVGLGKVDNTSDAEKEVSAKQATAIADAKKAGTDAMSALNTFKNTKGQANGIASLDANGRVPLAQLGNLDTSLYIIPSDNKLPTTGIQSNKIYLIKDAKGETQNAYREYIYVNKAWEEIGWLKTDIDLSGYAKLAGGNSFSGTQTIHQTGTDYSVKIDGETIEIGKGEGNTVISKDGMSLPEGSSTVAFSTDGGKIDTSVFAKTADLPSSLPANGGNADTVDGFHAAGLFQTLSAANGVLTVKIGNTQKTANVLTAHQDISGKSDKTHTHSVKINGVTKTIAASGGAAVDLGSYLPLSGGTVAGNIAVSKGTISVTDGTTTIGVGTTGLTFKTKDMTAANTFYLPSAGGTLALKGDIPSKLPADGGNADTLDNYHASGLFTAFGASGNALSISIGGTTKTFTPPFATNATNATAVPWSGVSGRPTKLSQFTDDVVSGKYLPLSGGKMTGRLTTSNFISFTLKGSDGSTTVSATIGSDGSNISDLMNHYLISYKSLTGTVFFGVTANAVTGTSFVKRGGTASQVLMANGSVAEPLSDDDIAAICV